MRSVAAALAIAGAAVGLRGAVGGFPVWQHPDEPIVGLLIQRAVDTSELSANWDGFAGFDHSRPTYQFSPYSLAVEAAARAADRCGLLERPLSVEAAVRFARGFSAWCGGLAVLLAFFSARTWRLGDGAGLLAAAFLATAFLSVQDGGYARVESFLSACVLAATAWAGRVARAGAPSGISCAGLGLAIGVAIAAKYNAAPCVALLWAARHAGRGRLLLAAACVPSGFLLATPEAIRDPAPLFAGIQWEARHYANGHQPHESFAWQDANLLYWPDYLARLGLGWVPTILGAAFPLRAWRRRGNPRVLAVFLALAAAMLWWPRVRFERNAEIALGPLCVAAAAAVVELVGTVCRRFGRNAAAAVLAAALGGTLVQNGVAVRRYRAAQQWGASEKFPPWALGLRAVPMLDGPRPDWLAQPTILVVGFSDPFSRRGLAAWREALADHEVAELRAPWLAHGYPFSTVEVYHRAGVGLAARKR